MSSLINKQLLLTAYAYLYITEQQKDQQGSEALQSGMHYSSRHFLLPCITEGKKVADDDEEFCYGPEFSSLNGWSCPDDYEPVKSGDPKLNTSMENYHTLHTNITKGPGQGATLGPEQVIVRFGWGSRWVHEIYEQSSPAASRTNKTRQLCRGKHESAFATMPKKLREEWQTKWDKPDNDEQRKQILQDMRTKELANDIARHISGITTLRDLDYEGLLSELKDKYRGNAKALKKIQLACVSFENAKRNKRTGGGDAALAQQQEADEKNKSVLLKSKIKANKDRNAVGRDTRKPPNVTFIANPDDGRIEKGDGLDLRV